MCTCCPLRVTTRRLDMADLLRDFEALLVHKHRFALSDVITCLQTIVGDLQDVQRVLKVASCSSDKKSADLLSRVSRRLHHLVALIPSFLGDQELATLMHALQEFGRVSDGLEMHPKLQQSICILMDHSQALAAAVTRETAVCTLLTKKRDHLATFLEEVKQVLQNSHSKRIEQQQHAIEQFTAEFKLALEVADEFLQRAKQLHFDIQTIETSMSTMLLPHFEICRTITTANAQVLATGSTFSKAECDEIDNFVRTAAKLKNGDTTFRRFGFYRFCGAEILYTVLLQCTSSCKSVPGTAYIIRTSCEQGAWRLMRKDAFLVCSSALKLQFRESLDQELFLAYIEDLSAKYNVLQLTEASNEYQAATSHLQELKVAIGRAHKLVQTSQENLALDDPARDALAQEVARIFHDEGGVLTSIDLPQFA
ncbi:Hypothetical protein PHPALM_10132 [Phytophthora palmivora]|uniref:Uncharacterized protein n=1 Tax=Phytophthora palmivora TaxID=4796 RepID=A0A2P4Y5I9_9STRA|nr:Hypothetical protein PHPALM_10132 [Phytophthora palmivora]